MKITSLNPLLVGISTILVLALVGTPMIYAESQTDSLLYDLKQIEIQINELKDNTSVFNIDDIGSQTFKLKTIGESLLEIKKSADVKVGDYEISKITDYLINDYVKLYKSYSAKASDYQRHNTVSTSEQLVINELEKNELNFVAQNNNQNNKELQNKSIKSEIERLQNEAKFQNLINKIGAKLADDANGNKVQKIQHKLALENVISTANWELAPAALDRVITQHSDPELKTQMIQNKEKILSLIEQLHKVKQQKPQLYTLTSGYAFVFFGDILNNENEIYTPNILISQIKSEIYSIAKQSDSIIKEDEKKQYETLLAQRIDSQIEDHEDSKRKKLLESQSEPEQTPEPEPEQAPEPEPEQAPEPEPEQAPEPEPEQAPGNNGNGNGNGNSNGNGNTNNNAGGNDGGNDSGNDNGNDNNNGNGNGSSNDGGNDTNNDKGNGKGNGKEKGKKS